MSPNRATAAHDAARSGRRARRLALAFSILALIAILWSMRGLAVVGAGTPGPTVKADRASLAAAAHVAEIAEPRRAPGETSDAAIGGTQEPSAAQRRRQRDEIRARILAARAQEASARDASRPTKEAEPPHTQSGGLTDRVGGRDALVAALNDDFMPLADECIDAARERDPSLEGMLAVSLEVIADEEHGAIVESVAFSEHNEVHDALLHECIRETSLSTILPPPPEGGREGFMLTLPIEP